jgi:hypothetical protein
MAYRRWLSTLAFEHPTQQIALQDYVDAVMDAERRLKRVEEQVAITKARGWIDDIRLGRIGSFAEIAEREVQGERHIRLLAPLAFRTAPADLTVHWPRQGPALFLDRAGAEGRIVT